MSASVSETLPTGPRRYGRRTGTSSRAYKVYDSFHDRLSRELPNVGPRARCHLQTVHPSTFGGVPDKRCSAGSALACSLDRTWTARMACAPTCGWRHWRALHLELTSSAPTSPTSGRVYHYSAIAHPAPMRAGDSSALTAAPDRNRPSPPHPSCSRNDHVLAQRLALPGRAPGHFWPGTSLSPSLPSPRRASRGQVVLVSPTRCQALPTSTGTRESSGRCALGHTRTVSSPPPRPLDLLTGGSRRRESRHASRCTALPVCDRRGRARGGHAVASPDATADPRSPRCSRCHDRLDTRPPEQIIIRRRSTRNYDTDMEIPFDAFSTLLERSTRGVASDVLVPGAPLTDLYLIVNGVQGLAPGIYLHHPQLGAVELLREGTFARRPPASQRSEYRARRQPLHLAHLPSYCPTATRLQPAAARRRPARRQAPPRHPCSGLARWAHRLRRRGDRSSPRMQQARIRLSHRRRQAPSYPRASRSAPATATTHAPRPRATKGRVSRSNAGGLGPNVLARDARPRRGTAQAITSASVGLDVVRAVATGTYVSKLAASRAEPDRVAGHRAGQKGSSRIHGWWPGRVEPPNVRCRIR